MSNANSYRVNSPTIINETVDGESVIINLEKGYYYSLDHVGSAIWEAINADVPVESIKQMLRERFECDSATMERSLERLLSELTQENLIVPGDGNGTLAASNTCSKEPFAEPTLNKFGDMQDLLLLDPIHEVDEKGWPFSNPQSTQQ